MKVDFDAGQAVKNTLDVFKKVKGSKDLMDEIGEFLVKRIQAETRSGKPFNDSRSFPSLAKSTVKNRERLSKLNKTHKTFKDSRSNLTFTGQLVNGIQFRIIDKGVVEIITQGKRKPYKIGARRSAKKTSISSRNEVLARVLKEIGFILFTNDGIRTDPKLIRRVNNIVLKRLRRALRVSSQIAS